MDWTKLSRELRTQNWITLMILGTASFFLMNAAFTLGVILGGLIIIANFRVLQHTIRCAFSDDGAFRTNKMAIIGKYYFRLAIMAALIYLLISSKWVDPMGLAIGLSIVVISIIYVGIRSAWKSLSGEAI